MKIIYGTSNQAKIAQVKDYLDYKNIDVEILSLKDIGFNEEIDENIFEMCNICSTTDCTGLIQVVPRTEAELESYEELYPFRPPFLPRDDDLVIIRFLL